MIVPKRYIYCAIIFICGIYTHQQEAGNGLGREQKEDDDKKISIVKNEPSIKCIRQKKECSSCKSDQRLNKNPLWSPCKRERWYHDQCKLGRPFKELCGNSMNYFQRNRSGLIPLSMAIFRGRKESERENSRAIVSAITRGVGENVLNMVLLCDHHQCSAWMHAIYNGDPVVVEAIVAAVRQQTDDLDAVWKLLMDRASGGNGFRKETALMVAVKKKNIPVIKVLMSAAGKRLDEYLDVRTGWGQSLFSLAKKDYGIVELLLSKDFTEVNEISKLAYF